MPKNALENVTPECNIFDSECTPILWFGEKRFGMRKYYLEKAK